MLTNYLVYLNIKVGGCPFIYGITVQYGESYFVDDILKEDY